MSEPNDDQLVDFNAARAIDLYIGAMTLRDGVEPTAEAPQRVAVFAAQVLNSSYFNVIMENVRELQDNSWTISIEADPETLSERVAGAMNLQVGDKPLGQIFDFQAYKAPSCTVRVETIKQQDVEYFDQDLAHLDVKQIKGTKLLFPLYHFKADQFEGKNTQEFIAALREHGYWRLIIQDANTKAAYVVHNVHASISSSATGRKGKGRRERRAERGH